MDKTRAGYIYWIERGYGKVHTELLLERAGWLADWWGGRQGRGESGLWQWGW